MHCRWLGTTLPIISYILKKYLWEVRQWYHFFGSLLRVIRCIVSLNYMEWTIREKCLHHSFKFWKISRRSKCCDPWHWVALCGNIQAALSIIFPNELCFVIIKLYNSMENILNIITGKHASINLNGTFSCLYQINVHKVTHWIQVAIGRVLTVVTVRAVEREMMTEVEVMLAEVLMVVAWEVTK